MRPTHYPSYPKKSSLSRAHTESTLSKAKPHLPRSEVSGKPPRNFEQDFPDDHLKVEPGVDYLGPEGDPRRYKVIRELGKGVFGHVYVVEWNTDYSYQHPCGDIHDKKRPVTPPGMHPKLVEMIRQGKPLALKVVKNHPAYRKYAEREVRILRYLEEVQIEMPSPEPVAFPVLNILDHFACRGHLIHVTEKFNGDLYNMTKEMPLTLPQTRAVGRQLLEALRLLHAFGVFHTDLKPENVFLSIKGDQSNILTGNISRVNPHNIRLILGDFGSAYISISSASYYNPSEISSIFYRPPEALGRMSSYYTLASDTWAAGCIIAECITKRPIFAGRDATSVLTKIERKVGPVDETLLKSLDVSRNEQDPYANPKKLAQDVISDMTSADNRRVDPARRELGRINSWSDYYGHPEVFRDLVRYYREYRRRRLGRSTPLLNVEVNDLLMAAHLVSIMCHPYPTMRPPVAHLLMHPFFQLGLCADESCSSCLRYRLDIQNLAHKMKQDGTEFNALEAYRSPFVHPPGVPCRPKDPWDPFVPITVEEPVPQKFDPRDSSFEHPLPQVAVNAADTGGAGRPPLAIRPPDAHIYYPSSAEDYSRYRLEAWMRTGPWHEAVDPARLVIPDKGQHWSRAASTMFL
eukprot:gnl/Dysnectes_brevis/525_a581_4311.p1 GENE.gnl/Dysnectes_brevis/525_a581_4311~~gnl/Dysnectes_brevis/525_a581_4311.p1  ORF type:complete len:632 (+),score=193.78 gnl/Dysnectes_brevis/525_a581_4311:164-2059(+)